MNNILNTIILRLLKYAEHFMACDQEVKMRQSLVDRRRRPFPILIDIPLITTNGSTKIVDGLLRLVYQLTYL